MIEEGLVSLVQGTPAVLAIAPTGGYLKELPKDHALPSWTHCAVSDSSAYHLTGRSNPSGRRIQIDCFADDPDDMVGLAEAIDTVLDGYKGTLPDTNHTVVQGIFRTNLIDFFDDAGRSYRRMLEYMVWFNQA